MDTRVKIVSVSRAFEEASTLRSHGEPVASVVGIFDVLTAGHTRRLQNLADNGVKLFILVTEYLRDGQENTLLPQNARAELVAALRSVHRVVPVGANEALVLATQIAPGYVINESAADQSRRAALIDLVRARYQAG